MCHASSACFVLTAGICHAALPLCSGLCYSSNDMTTGHILMLLEKSMVGPTGGTKVLCGCSMPQKPHINRGQVDLH